MKLPILDNNNIKYILKAEHRKNVSIKYTSNGIIKIVYPYFYNETQVNICINKLYPKIVEFYKINIQKEARYETGEEFKILNKIYRIMVVESKHPKVILLDDILYLYTSKDEFKTKEKIINSWLIDQAEIVFNEELYKMFNLMKRELDSYPKLICKKFKSVWGLCKWQQNTISINIDLLHTDIDCIDGVIAHELCHFKYHDHQQGFHEMLNRYVDEYTIRRKLRSYKFKR